MSDQPVRVEKRSGTYTHSGPVRPDSIDPDVYDVWIGADGPIKVPVTMSETAAQILINLGHSPREILNLAAEQAIRDAVADGDLQAVADRSGATVCLETRHLNQWIT